MHCLIGLTGWGKGNLGGGPFPGEVWKPGPINVSDFTIGLPRYGKTDIPLTRRVVRNR